MSVTSKKYNKCESWNVVYENENADAEPNDNDASSVNNPVNIMFTGQSWYISAKQANKVSTTMDVITTRYKNHALNLIHSFNTLWIWEKWIILIFPLFDQEWIFAILPSIEYINDKEANTNLRK